MLKFTNPKDFSNSFKLLWSLYISYVTVLLLWLYVFLNRNVEKMSNDTTCENIKDWHTCMLSPGTTNCKWNKKDLVCERKCSDYNMFKCPKNRCYVSDKMCLASNTRNTSSETPNTNYSDGNVCRSYPKAYICNKSKKCSWGKQKNTKNEECHLKCSEYSLTDCPHRNCRVSDNNCVPLK